MRSTKDLIERLRSNASSGAISDCDLEREAADALELLTQPVGVEPEAWLTKEPDGDGGYQHDIVFQAERPDFGVEALYSAEQFAKLQADRDEWKHNAAVNNGNSIALADRCDALQKQVKILRTVLDDSSSTLDSLGYDTRRIHEALSDTEQKDDPK